MMAESQGFGFYLAMKARSQAFAFCFFLLFLVPWTEQWMLYHERMHYDVRNMSSLSHNVCVGGLKGVF